MSVNTCSGGGTATLQVNNDDCGCVSIARIVNNGSGTFTIFLSNGQSMPFTIPQGESGEIAMRVDSGYIQWQANGGTWTNLIAVSAITGPAGADGSSFFWNTATPVANAGTSGFETVYTGVVSLNKITTNGYGVTIETVFGCTGGGNGSQQVRILFDGQSITGSIPFFNPTDKIVGCKVQIVRTGAATATYNTTYYFATEASNGQITDSRVIIGGTLAGLDFTANTDVEMQIDAGVVGEVTMQSSSCIYNKTL